MMTLTVKGPLYLIEMYPHRMTIDPGDLDDLRIAVRHAIEATQLDPAKVEQAAVRYGPFELVFRAIVRADVRPHWAGGLRYAGQEIPLFRWDEAGSLFNLHEALYDAREP